MSRPICFLCPGCGKGLSAGPESLGRIVPCPACGRDVLVRACAEAVLAGPPLPVSHPPAPSTPAGFERVSPRPAAGRNRGRRWGLLGGVAVLLLLGGGVYLGHHLHRRQQEQEKARANQFVAAQVEAARVNMGHHHWDEALRLLHGALAVEGASNREEVRTLIATAEQGQARSLLECAERAIKQKDTAGALSYLRDYAGHPQATELPRASLLREEIERATSDAEAVRYLERMSDQALAQFSRGGEIRGDGPVQDAVVREIFKDTLRRHLPHEERKREARRVEERAEAARREARLRGSLPYLELAEFVKTTARKFRARKDLAARQEMALAQVFRQLNVTDRQEQARLRAGIEEGRDPAGLATELARKGEEAKQGFRRLGGHRRDDEEAFDRLVERELEKLLRELKTP